MSHTAPSLALANQTLETLDAHGRVAWALEHLPGEQVLSSSFGVQAALMLHLVNEVAPGIPVVFVDTGYHFPETYQFVDALTEQLRLNLKVYGPQYSAAWQEARYGKRWEQGRDAIIAYNQEAKVEPMQRALEELNVGTWFSGLRRSQSQSRAAIEWVMPQWERLKVHPVADWSDKEVYHYLTQHGLPYHPLYEQGYTSIGDWHTTRALKDMKSDEDARFFGLMRECGLHDLPETNSHS